MDIITLILAFLGAIVFSFVIGFLGFKFAKYLNEKKIQNNAKKFLKGELDNKTQLDDGRTIDVQKFITYDEHGNKVLIDMKGGLKVKRIENAKVEKKNKKFKGRSEFEERSVQATDFSPSRKNSKRLRGILRKLHRR